MNCVRTQSFDLSGCSKSCEGMNVLSYDVQELRDLEKMRIITKLSDQYNNHKLAFDFPTKFKSKFF